MKTKTAREVFGIVKEHLLAQNEIAAIAGKQRQCVFRTDSGLKCAIGCLIPDEKYHVDLETFYDLYVFNPLTSILESEGIFTVKDWAMCHMLTDLRDIHDNVSVFFWKTELDSLEKELFRS